jgi:Tfp pilus assembly protein PilN
MKRAGLLILVLALSAFLGIALLVVARLSDRLSDLESQIEDSDSRSEAVEELRPTIDALESKLEVIEDLESRMGLLESKVEDIAATLPSLEEEPEPAEKPEVSMPQENAGPQSQTGAGGAQPLTRAECEIAGWQWNENANVCD